MNNRALIDQKHNLRMNIWKLLTSRQKTLVARQIASPAFLEHLGYDALCKISKSELIRESYLTLTSMSSVKAPVSTSSPSHDTRLGANVIDAREAFKRHSERADTVTSETSMMQGVEGVVIYVDFRK